MKCRSLQRENSFSSIISAMELVNRGGRYTLSLENWILGSVSATLLGMLCECSSLVEYKQ